MSAIIAGGGGEEIVIATTGAGIAKTGMSAAAIAMTAGATGIGMIGVTGADRMRTGIPAPGGADLRALWPKGD